MPRLTTTFALTLAILTSLPTFAQNVPTPDPAATPATPAAQTPPARGANGNRGGRGAGRAAAPAAGGAAAPTPTQSTYKFSFGTNPPPAGFTQVPTDTTYTAGKFGFDMNTKPATTSATNVSSTSPFAFSVDLPEGNYKVTITTGDPTVATTTTFLAESRRLMLEKVTTDPGKTTTVDFIVNIRTTKVPPPPTNAPGGSEVRINSLDNPLTWDDKLSLEFTNSHPAISTLTIEPVTVPTVFILGDSTVTDQPRDPGASWGQMLPAFFKDTVAIANHATSGETMKSSITGLRLEKVLSQIKPGDYMFMQFGHNDEKASWPQTYVDPKTTFKSYMNVFISEALRKGATPVMISMMERSSGGPDSNSHGGFPQAYEDLAAETKVAFIDNWKNSRILYAAMGADKAAAFNDATHHKTYGAYELAKLVAQGIRDNKLPLAKALRDDFKPFDPAHPDKLIDFTVPMNISGNGRPPQGN